MALHAEKTCVLVGLKHHHWLLTWELTGDYLLKHSKTTHTSTANQPKEVTGQLTNHWNHQTAKKGPEPFFGSGQAMLHGAHTSSCIANPGHPVAFAGNCLMSGSILVCQPLVLGSVPKFMTINYVVSIFHPSSTSSSVISASDLPVRAKNRRYRWLPNLCKKKPQLSDIAIEEVSLEVPTTCLCWAKIALSWKTN